MNNEINVEEMSKPTTRQLSLTWLFFCRYIIFHVVIETHVWNCQRCHLINGIKCRHVDKDDKITIPEVNSCIFVQLNFSRVLQNIKQENCILYIYLLYIYKKIIFLMNSFNWISICRRKEFYLSHAPKLTQNISYIGIL